MVVPREHCHDVVNKLCNTVYSDNCKTVSRDVCEEIPEVINGQVSHEVCKDVPEYSSPAARLLMRCARGFQGSVWMFLCSLAMT